MKSINIEFEDIIGRYLNINVEDTNYRIYVEEAVQGIPLLCLHTAGSDGRQFRHILNDQKITQTAWFIIDFEKFTAMKQRLDSCRPLSQALINNSIDNKH